MTPEGGGVATNPRRSFRPRKSAGGVEVDPGKCFDGFVFDHFGSSVGLFYFYINYTTIFMMGFDLMAIFFLYKLHYYFYDPIRRWGGDESCRR